MQAQRKRTLSLRLCVPLVHTHNHPSRGPLARFIFLGCTSVSPVATKVPDPHWVWLLTSPPLILHRFLHCTPQGLLLSLLDFHLHPPFFPPSLPYRDFFQAATSGLSPPLISPLQLFLLFLHCLLTSFTPSLTHSSDKQFLSSAACQTLILSPGSQR